MALCDWVSEECDSYNVLSYYDLHDISWGWNGEYKRVKRKLNHIYHYQKDEYIKVVKELCGAPLSEEQKKKEFTRNNSEGKPYLAYAYYKIQDKEICKISNVEEIE